MTCQWDFDAGCIGGDDVVAAIDPDLWDRSLTLATDTLQSLTNYRVGTCPVTIRPVPEVGHCPCGYRLDNHYAYGWYTGEGFWPHMEADGLWYNHCPRYGRFSLNPLDSIDIPGPVSDISEFTISGVPVDLNNGDWAFMDGHLLVWQGSGPSPVPATQDLNQPIDAPGSWAITYSNSYPVDASGRAAVALLAMEYVQACKPKGKCSLPRGVTNVVRNGVTFTVSAGLFINGLTGIEVVDAFIVKWAPPGSPARTATVFSPRTAGRVRTINPMPFSG